MQWLDTTLALRVSVTGFALPSSALKKWSDRTIRPSDFSYKHRADRSITLILVPLTDKVNEVVLGGLKGVLDASPAGNPLCSCLHASF